MDNTANQILTTAKEIRDLISDPNLSYRAKCTYMVLRKFADQTGVCWPSPPTVARSMGYGIDANGQQRGIRQVQQDVSSLRDAGWIQTNKSGEIVLGKGIHNGKRAWRVNVKNNNTDAKLKWDGTSVMSAKSSQIEIPKEEKYNG